MADEAPSGEPRVSVVVEGYNESLDLGSADEVMAGLRSQSYPLETVEVLLVGSRDQCRHWSSRFGDDRPFHSVGVVEAEGAHYYALKNRGAARARGEFLALLDSDVVPMPSWLASLVEALESGVDVVGGLSLFRGEDGRSPDAPLTLTAASVSWGFVVGREREEGLVEARGFLSHNVGFRADLFERSRYREDLGRTCAGSFLFDELVRSGARVAIHPGQRVAHAFDLPWWLSRLHRRFGYEVFRLKRLEEDARHGWVTSVPVAEPILTMGWHVVLDLGRWWRFGRLLGLGPLRRVLHYPLLLLLSVAARGSEAIGMYQTLRDPEAMESFALSN